jgi:hypothetical protein
MNFVMVLTRLGRKREKKDSTLKLGCDNRQGLEQGSEERPARLTVCRRGRSEPGKSRVTRLGLALGHREFGKRDLRAIRWLRDGGHGLALSASDQGLLSGTREEQSMRRATSGLMMELNWNERRKCCQIRELYDHSGSEKCWTRTNGVRAAVGGVHLVDSASSSDDSYRLAPRSRRVVIGTRQRCGLLSICEGYS